MKKVWRVGLEWVMEAAYSDQVIGGVAEYSRRFGPFRFLTSWGGDFELTRLHERSDLDGIIVYRNYSDDPLSEVRWPEHIPIVSTEGSDSRITAWQVRRDDIAVGRLIATQFLERKFRQFAYVPSFGGQRDMEDWDARRLEGFTQVIRSAGAEVVVYCHPGDSLNPGEYRWAGLLPDWLKRLPKPIGVMAAKDHCARQLLLAAEIAGVIVPEEVAVIGVDNQRWVELASPTLSSVELDGFRTGYLAMELLHRRMEKLDVPPQIIAVPPGPLIVRRSSEVSAIHDQDVAAALRFIADHATSGIRVQHVVYAVAVSRRQLEYRFKAVLRRSILSEIRRVQIHRAKLVLADRHIPLGRVAQVCGFSSGAVLSKIFRRVTGITPSRYRKSLLEKQ